MALSKRFIKFAVTIVAAFMAMLVFAGCASSNATEPAGYTFADDTVSGQVETNGNSLLVRLDSNPTTGYEWSADVSGDGLVLEGSEYTDEDSASAANSVVTADEDTMVGRTGYTTWAKPTTASESSDEASNAVGVSGYDTFHFRGTGEGQQTITFTYARPNETNADDKTVVVTTHTDASGNIVSTETTSADGSVLGSTQM